MKTEEILEALRVCATHEEKGCGSCKQRPFVHCQERLAEEAIALIERLTALPEQLGKEIEWKEMVIDMTQRKLAKAEADRDAAFDEIKHLGRCSVCKNMLNCSKNGRRCESLSGPRGYERWEWRGTGSTLEEGKDGMKVSDLKPGDVVNIYGERFTVKSVHTSGGNTTIIFEDVPTTKERCDALKKLANDTGCIAAMLSVQPPRTSRYCGWTGLDLLPLSEVLKEGEKDV